jgi:hypothetical protein
MDDKTTAPHPAAPTGRPARRRRALAAAALLLSVSAAVSACGSSGGGKSAASGASASVATSASPAPSGSASGAPSTAATAGASAAPGGAGGAAPTQAGDNPSAPLKTQAPGGGPIPVDPIHHSAAFKPESYLSNGNQLTVFFTGGICSKYALKVNEEPSGTVGVDVVVSQAAPAGQNCPALSKRQSVVGTLSQPLNGRSVVSLRDNSPVPLESAPNGGPVSAGN